MSPPTWPLPSFSGLKAWIKRDKSRCTFQMTKLSSDVFRSTTPSRNSLFSNVQSQSACHNWFSCVEKSSQLYTKILPCQIYEEELVVQKQLGAERVRISLCYWTHRKMRSVLFCSLFFFLYSPRFVAAVISETPIARNTKIGRELPWSNKQIWC